MSRTPDDHGLEIGGFTAGTIDPDEIAGVLSHYDIGDIRSIRVYPRGSSRSPKALIHSSIGPLLLKRRGPGRDDPYRITFEHEVHERLWKMGYPVVEIIRSARSRSTVVRSGGGIYELFRYVKAARCDGSEASLKSCGRAMATLHESLKDLELKAPEVTSYHAVKELTTIVNRYAGTLRSRGRRACATLVEAYDESVECVEALGWSSWPTSVVHGDWHPGNVLFGEDGEVALVLDFDAVRADPRVADIAAAVLHFGRYVNSRGDHDESSWPVRVDGDAACEFLRGYIQATSIPLEGTELAAIPALMIEAVILETMPSMIRDGRFGHHDAKAFLPLVATSVERLQAESGRLIGQMRAMVR